jgi:endonuclease YncB( thermonuclease family)
MTIELSGYTKFLSEIQNCLKQTQDEIINTVTRQKVVMSWQIGQLIDGHLKKNNRAGYGEKLFAQLEQDISISQRVLYKMRSFYQSYPKLPKDDNKLNWSHYQLLSNIKEKDKRKYFESLAQQQNLDVRTLEYEIKNSEPQDKKSAAEKTKKNSKKVTTKPEKVVLTKLRPERGKLFSYPILKLSAEQKNYIDLGFKIFREAEGKLPQDAKIVDATKVEDGYIYKKSSNNARKLNTYLAQLERVVDGDTIHVLIDLGFKTKHSEILRLAKINAPEISTVEGKRSSDFLKRTLENIPFLIIRTFQTDIYGRYIADVFLPTKTSPNFSSPDFAYKNFASKNFEVVQSKTSNAAAKKEQDLPLKVESAQNKISENSAQKEQILQFQSELSQLPKNLDAAFAAAKKGKIDLQQIADEGVYLNQLLLESGVVETY